MESPQSYPSSCPKRAQSELQLIRDLLAIEAADCIEVLSLMPQSMKQEGELSDLLDRQDSEIQPVTIIRALEKIRSQAGLNLVASSLKDREKAPVLPYFSLAHVSLEDHPSSIVAPHDLLEECESFLHTTDLPEAEVFNTYYQGVLPKTDPTQFGVGRFQKQEFENFAVLVDALTQKEVDKTRVRYWRLGDQLSDCTYFTPSALHLMLKLIDEPLEKIEFNDWRVTHPHPSEALQAVAASTELLQTYCSAIAGILELDLRDVAGEPSFSIWDKLPSSVDIAPNVESYLPASNFISALNEFNKLLGVDEKDSEQIDKIARQIGVVAEFFEAANYQTNTFAHLARLAQAHLLFLGGNLEYASRIFDFTTKQKENDSGLIDAPTVITSQTYHQQQKNRTKGILHTQES